MHRILAILCLMTAFWIVSDAETARGDIILDGEKVVKNTFTVDFGRWDAYVPRTITIAKGDTVSGLAKKHLGSAKRAPEIAAANPGLDPKRLLPGKDLTIPAREKAPKHLKVPVFYGIRMMHGGLERIRPGRVYEPGRYGHFVLAIAPEKVATFEREYMPRKKQHTLGNLKRGDLPAWIARSELLPFSNTIRDTDPTASIHTVIELQDVKDAKVHIKRGKVIRRNRHGKVVSAGGVASNRRVLFAGLSAIGMVGLALTLLRRRRGLGA